MAERAALPVAAYHRDPDRVVVCPALASAMRPQIRRDSSPLPPGTAVCLGAFDGLHLGHRALADAAREHGDRVALVTFDPHPQRVLAPDRPLVLLATAAQRERNAAALGVDTLVLVPFDLALSKLSAEQFIVDWLVALRPTAVVVGADFRFGAGRKGDAALLQALLPEHGIAVQVVAPVAAAEGSAKISSSTIRDAIGRGEVEAAARMLGRPHAVIGTVVQGDRRGRTIGFPTANVANAGPLPKVGIYAVWLVAATPVSGLWGPVAGAASIGTNPTFAGERAPRLEVHVIDRDLGESLYGKTVEVWFVERLRDEQKYDGVDALVEQIGKDVDRARTRLVDADADGVLSPPEPMPEVAS
jgi:riboflavin kinase/FMN adenylyltransferase